MPTGTLGTNARQDPRQVVNTMKFIVNYNDVGVGVGRPHANYLPMGAYITLVQTEIVQAFNGTTPLLSVGTVAAAYNNIIANADMTIGTLGVYEATRSYGRSLANLADVLPVLLFTVGGAPTTGRAVITICYEGGWDS